MMYAFKLHPFGRTFGMKDSPALQRTILYSLICIALLPVMAFRDFMPTNELRYLSIVDEALRDGTVFTFHNHGAPYADKPPLWFWMAMLGRTLFGCHCVYFLSLLQLIPAIVTNEVFHRWYRRAGFPESVCNTALCVLFTCGIFLAMTVTLRMDMLMAMFIALALKAGYEICTGAATAKRKWLLGLWVFLAVFSKGPMGILIPAACLAAYCLTQKNFKGLGACFGWRFWVAALSLCALWWGCVWAEGGSGYIRNLLFHQTVDRAVNSFHHKEPFWYYFLTSLYTFQPWTLVLFGTIIVAAARKTALDALQRFHLTVIVTTFIALSCISSKIEIYLLPVYPFVVYLGVSLAGRKGQYRWTRGFLLATAVIIALALPGLLVALKVARLREYFHLPMFTAAACALTISGMAATVLAARGRLSASMRTIAAGVLSAVFIAGLGVTALNPYIGYRALSDKAAEMLRKHDADTIVFYRMKRPENMDVYLGDRVRIEIADSLPTALSPGKLYVTPTAKAGELPRLPETADTASAPPYTLTAP